MERYQIQELVGSGSGGAVYRSKIADSEEIVAVKILKGPIRKNMQSEFELISKLSHPGIVSMRDTVSDPVAGVVYIVMEYIDGVSLRSILGKQGPLTMAAAQQVFRQLVEAVAYLHSHGLVHRDIKPDNVMVLGCPQISVKLIDFGLCRKAEGATGACGTPKYYPPEMMTNACSDLFKLDVWSLGIFLYEILTGNLPKAVVQGKVTILNFKSIRDSQVRKLLRSCHVGNARFRASAAQLLQMVWLTDTAAEGVTHDSLPEDAASAEEEDCLEFSDDVQRSPRSGRLSVRDIFEGRDVNPCFDETIRKYQTPESRIALFTQVSKILKNKCKLGRADIDIYSYSDLTDFLRKATGGVYPRIPRIAESTRAELSVFPPTPRENLLGVGLEPGFAPVLESLVVVAEYETFDEVLKSNPSRSVD